MVGDRGEIAPECFGREVSREIETGIGVNRHGARCDRREAWNLLEDVPFEGIGGIVEEDRGDVGIG